MNSLEVNKWNRLAWYLITSKVRFINTRRTCSSVSLRYSAIMSMHWWLMCFHENQNWVFKQRSSFSVLSVLFGPASGFSRPFDELLTWGSAFVPQPFQYIIIQTSNWNSILVSTEGVGVLNYGTNALAKSVWPCATNSATLPTPPSPKNDSKHSEIVNILKMFLRATTSASLHSKFSEFLGNVLIIERVNVY